MKWKTLLSTIAVSILIFFTLVFLGMKFQWVRALQDKKILENEKVTLVIPKNPSPKTSKPELIDEKELVVATDTTTDAKNGFSHSLVGEETQLVDFTGMPLELVAEECKRISIKVGVPTEQLTESVNECTTHNFQGRIAEDATDSRNVKANLRKQCKTAIPIEQQELFSPEEMKLIIDECVADTQQ
jgi:hypothetical protein